MNTLLNIFAAVNGNENDLGNGAIIAVVSVILVFIILAAIIAITYVVALAINKVQAKTAKTAASNEQVSSSPLDLADEDATVAALIASIECRNETKQNVKVISVKEIK